MHRVPLAVGLSVGLADFFVRFAQELVGKVSWVRFALSPSELAFPPPCTLPLFLLHAPFAFGG